MAGIGQLNRRALESLIHSGALDALEPDGNRAQLMADLDLLLDWASARARDRASGQGNLLDLLGGGSDSEAASSTPASAPKAAPNAAPNAAPKPAPTLLGRRACEKLAEVFAEVFSSRALRAARTAVSTTLDD